MHKKEDSSTVKQTDLSFLLALAASLMAASAKPTNIKTPPNLKTWVLKTSIHCEGCRKKVVKIVHNTPGVYESDVDLKLQKVTVSGNVDINALIAKLIKKTGKHAELLPQQKTEQQQPPKKHRQPKPKPPLDDARENVNAEEVKANEKQQVTKEEKPNSKTNAIPPTDQCDGEKAQKQNVKVKPPAVEATGGSEEKNGEKEVKPQLEKSKETADVKPETVDEKQNTAADGEAADETESGNIGKKMKKKGQNRKQNSEKQEGKDSFSDATPTNDRSFQYYKPNHSPTRQTPAHMYGPPPSYHAPPVYTVSYNTTPYPTSSYGTSYYAMPPPHSDAYAYSSSNPQYQPSDFASYQSQPSDGFQFFCDENPNACSLM